MKRKVLALTTSAFALLLACAHESERTSAPAASSPQASSPQASSQQASSPQASSSQAAAPGASAATASTQAGSAADARQTIDCPPSSLAQAEKSLPSASGVGTPSGAGTGSGAEAVSGQGQTRRVEGQITQIDSSRTARGIEVGGVKLWVEPSTPVLIDCQQASVAELEQGTPVKAMYEEKNGRNIAKVVEARRQ